MAIIQKQFSDIITFSRPSPSAYIEDGILKFAAADAPVFEGGAWRLRPQETNLLWASEGTNMVNDLININRTLDNGAVLFVRTRDDLNCYTGTSRVGNFANKRVTATLDIEVRPDSDNVGFRFQATYPARVDVIFRADTRTASVTTNSIPSSNPEVTVEPLAGDTYRVSLTATVTQPSGGTVFYFGPTKKTTEVSWESDLSISRCYIRRAQFNEGDPIPYIPTTSSQVTRPADNAPIVGSAFTGVFNPEGWAIVLDLQTQAPATALYANPIISIANSSGTNRIVVAWTPGAQIYVTCRFDGMPTEPGIFQTYPAMVSTEGGKLAIAGDSQTNKLNFYWDGQKHAQSFTLYPDRMQLLTQIIFRDGAVYSSARHKGLHIFRTRPTDAFLEAQTS